MSDKGYKEKAGGSLEPVLRLSVKVLINESKELSFAQKLELIKEDFAPYTPAQLQSEINSANLLEGLKNDGAIIDWCRPRKNSFLDEIQADFVIIRSQDEAVCLQMCTAGKRGQERRRKVNELFYPGAIAVVTVKTWENQPKSVDFLRKQISSTIKNPDLIVIDL